MKNLNAIINITVVLMIIIGIALALTLTIKEIGATIVGAGFILSLVWAIVYPIQLKSTYNL